MKLAVLYEVNVSWVGRFDRNLMTNVLKGIVGLDLLNPYCD